MELEKKILYLMDHITFRLNGVTLGENGPKISNNVSKEDLVEAFNHMINTKDRYKTSAELDMILKDSSLLSKTNFMIDNDIIEPEKIFNSLSEVLRSKKGYAEILSSDIACKKLELLFKFPL